MIDRTAKYSELSKKPTLTREQVIAVLGQPEKSVSNRISPDLTFTDDTYKVKGRVYNSYEQYGKNMGIAMTLGLVELVNIPVSIWEIISQAFHPTEKNLIIHYTNNSYVYQKIIKNPFKNCRLALR